MFDNPNENSGLASDESYETKALQIEAEETEVLKTLLAKQNKQLFYTRVSSIAMVVFVLVVIAVCMIIVPKAVNTLYQVDATLKEADAMMVEADKMIAEAQKSLDSIDSMTGEITNAASGINTLVNDNSEVLNESMKKISDIDFEGLNKGIADLQAVIEPMAKFMSKFR